MLYQSTSRLSSCRVRCLWIPLLGLLLGSVYSRVRLVSRFECLKAPLKYESSSESTGAWLLAIYSVASALGRILIGLANDNWLGRELRSPFEPRLTVSSFKQHLAHSSSHVI